jgi:cytidine deaminase
LEVHSFEEMETQPATEASQVTNEMTKLVIAELAQFRNEFMDMMQQGDNDINSFWLRKTHKPVLAVLAVQMPHQSKPVLYRGTNMEVSMPTGSLCAERNVIGTALAQNPSLHRQDLKLIAVLAVPQVEPASSAAAAVPKEHYPAGNLPPTAMGIMRPNSTSISSIIETSGSSNATTSDSWPALPLPLIALPLLQNVPSTPPLIASTPPLVPSTAAAAAAALSNGMLLPPPSMPLDATTAYPRALEPNTPPARRIALFEGQASHVKPTMGGSHRGKKQKRTVVVHSSEDLNPLRPCGSCNEWLKKIAESNPYFQILTFTDANCNGVYCTPCQE